MKICLAGTGAMGAIHMKALQKIGGVEVMAVNSRTDESGKAFAAEWRIPFSSTSLEACIDRPGVDAVILTTPSALHAEQTILALAVIVLGIALLAACIFEFARSGRGTLSPVDPPRHLVVRGLYRYVRNPMYLSVTTILLGEVLLARSPALAAYWAVWFAAANLFVIAYEEPALRQKFGSSYDEYARRVGRWMPWRRR